MRFIHDSRCGKHSVFHVHVLVGRGLAAVDENVAPQVIGKGVGSMCWWPFLAAL